VNAAAGRSGAPWWLLPWRDIHEPDCHGIKNNGFTALAEWG